MLELMIALFLVGLCALPLAQFPTRAAKEEYNSAYRMQAQRLADLAFAEVKEKLYRQEISWKTISSAQSAKSIIPIDAMDVSIDPPYKKKFSRQATIYSVGKKTQNAEQWRLATIRIKITPQQKGIKLFRSKKSTAASRVFTYQVLINKAPISETTPSTLEPLPIKETR